MERLYIEVPTLLELFKSNTKKLFNDFFHYFTTNILMTRRIKQVMRSTGIIYSRLLYYLFKGLLGLVYAKNTQCWIEFLKLNLQNVFLCWEITPDLKKKCSYIVFFYSFLSHENSCPQKHTQTRTSFHKVSSYIMLKYVIVEKSKLNLQN